MRKSLYAVLAALFVLIAVSGCTQVRFVNPNEGEGTVPVGTAIKSITELEKAAAGYGEYYLANDIILDEQLTITGEITLNGNGHTISRAAANTGDGPGTRATLLITSSNVTIKNITVDGLDTIKDWTPGEYAIKAYGSETDQLTGIVFEDIEIIDSNAGMLVRGADVTLKGNIVLDNVEYGGIGVDSDGKANLKSALDVSDCKFKSTPILRDKPAIWKEDKNALNETVTGWKDANLKEIVGTGNDDNQTYYVTRGFKG